jgi:predicted alpha/beta hydrolase
MSSCSTISAPRRMAEVQAPRVLPVQASDGHQWGLLSHIPTQPRAALLWLPALGVAARHYAPLAEALAARGIAVFVHEWRGHGSSSLRAGRRCDWGYRELLTLDLPASEAAISAVLPSPVERIVGGHSLGGQLATCRLALAPASARRLWLIASGAPFWRAFPAPLRQGLPLACRLLPWLADRAGALPGRRIGFGGREARGVMHDWADSARSGRYGAAGLEADIETAFARVEAETTAVLLRRDWYAPESSLRFLLSKLPNAHCTIEWLDDAALGMRSDHFGWMRRPDMAAERLTAALRDQARTA